MCFIIKLLSCLDLPFLLHSPSHWVLSEQICTKIKLKAISFKFKLKRKMHLNWPVQMATALTFANQFSQTKAIVSQVNWYQSAANPNLRHLILRPGGKWKRSSKKVTQLFFWNQHKTDLKPFFEVAIDALPSMQTMIRSINLSLSFRAMVLPSICWNALEIYICQDYLKSLSV